MINKQLNRLNFAYILQKMLLELLQNWQWTPSTPKNRTQNEQIFQIKHKIFQY